MKAIINGKTYNTATATQIGSYDNGLSYSDFDYFREALYRKRNGEFFLVGEGHARTKYARNYGDCWGYGSRAIPISTGTAKLWLETYGDHDEYAAIFGGVAE